jgi:hypothetical protein
MGSKRRWLKNVVVKWVLGICAISVGIAPLWAAAGEVPASSRSRMNAMAAEVMADPEQATKLYAEYEWQYIYKRRNSLALWQESFASIPDVPMWSQFKELIGYQRSCESKVKSIWALVKNYGDLLKEKDSTLVQIQQQQRAIQDLINEKDSSTGQCRSDVQKHYIGASVALLTRADRQLQGPQKGQLQLPLETHFAYLTFSWLFRNKIAPVVDERAFQTRSPHSTLGTFECTSESFSVTVLSNPLNLGATVIHEFQHLLGDKLSYLNVRLPADGDDPIGIPHGMALWQLKHENFRQFLVLDESLASLRAAWMQKKFHTIEWKTPQSPENIKDLTLFRKDGYLEKLLGFLNSKQNRSEGIRNLSEGLGDFNDVASLHLGGSNNRSVVAFRRQFLSEVFKIYFQNTPTETELKLLDPQLLGDSLLNNSVGPGEQVFLQSLFTFGLDAPIPSQWGHTALSKQEFRQRYSDPRSHVFWIQYKMAAADGSLYPPMLIEFRQVLAMLASLTAPLFERESVICTELQKVVSSPNNSIASYLGIKKSQMGEPVPDGSATNPGDEGVRPGDEGVRPGDEGVRPGDSAVRPCLELGTVL